jgi:hypothetical protein
VEAARGPSRTCTAALSTNVPSPIPTDSVLTLSTFVVFGVSTGDRVSHCTYSPDGATCWSVG